jgi:transposase
MGRFEKKAQREHRTLLLWDETGHSFRARPGTTWARRGITPMLQRVSKRREVSSVVAITPDGRLLARHFRTSVSSDTVILALRYFRRQIGTPLLVVWDRLNAHRSRATSAFIAAHAQDYAVAYLPAYAPELNPEEQCNACVKRAMENALPGSVADLHRLARREFGRLQRRPELITSFFRHAGLSVTGIS